MPKDEFDFEDPFALNGVALPTAEDTTELMTETFIEEFLRMGHSPDAILDVFRNPQYLGPHLALRQRGEPFVRDRISEMAALWGRPSTAGSPTAVGEDLPSPATALATPERATRPPTEVAAPDSTDPLGAPLPTVNR